MYEAFSTFMYVSTSFVCNVLIYNRNHFVPFIKKKEKNTIQTWNMKHPLIM